MSLLTSRAPVLPLGALPRVDLLPPSEMRRRDMLSRARTWVYIGIAALAVAVLAVGGAWAYNMTTSLRLIAEQSRTQQILAGIAELSEVSRALSTRGALQGMRTEAMAGDLAWVPVLDLVAAHLPDGVVITEYALEAGPVPVDGADPTTATGVSGTVTFTSPAAVDFVAATRELRSAEGMRGADLAELTSAEGVFTYTVRVELDQSVYTGAFAPEGE
jgi:Tfp pilus assembly protein PilN